MSGFSSVIRGGQTTLHNWRMGMQIVKIVFFWTPIFIILASLAWSFYTMKRETFKVAIIYYRAHIEGWHGDDYRFSYKSTRGVERSFSIRTIKLHPAFANAANEMQAMVIKASIRGGVIALTLALVMLLVFFLRGRKLSEKKRVRGAQLVKPRVLNRITRRGYSFTDKRRYRLGGVLWPKRGETLHTLIVGSTGTGKTVAMKNLLDEIRARGDKAIIYDKMRSFVPDYFDAKRDVILNPFDSRAPTWDVFGEARSSEDFETMAAALIPQHKDTADPFWVTAARMLFATGAAAQWREKQWSNKTLLDNLLRADLKKLADLMKDNEMQSIIDPKNPKTALSVRAILTASIRVLGRLSEDDERFSIRDWVSAKGDGFLFLTSRADMHESMQALISTWLEIATVGILSLERNEKRRIWFIIDELPTLAQIPSLTSLLREGRQFGACVVLGTQAISELREIYGREGAETISANCNTRLVLHTPDRATADWNSDALGRVEIQMMNQGYSYGANEIRDGVNYSERQELQPLVLPTEIMRLKPLLGYLKMPQGLPVSKIHLRYKTRKVKAKGFIARPEASPLDPPPPLVDGGETIRGHSSAPRAAPRLPQKPHLANPAVAASEPPPESQYDVSTSLSAHPYAPNGIDGSHNASQSRADYLSSKDKARDEERAAKKQPKKQVKEQATLPLDSPTSEGNRTPLPPAPIAASASAPDSALADDAQADLLQETPESTKTATPPKKPKMRNPQHQAYYEFNEPKDTNESKNPSARPEF